MPAGAGGSGDAGVAIIRVKSPGSAGILANPPPFPAPPMRRVNSPGACAGGTGGGRCSGGDEGTGRFGDANMSGAPCPGPLVDGRPRFFSGSNKRVNSPAPGAMPDGTGAAPARGEGCARGGWGGPHGSGEARDGWSVVSGERSSDLPPATPKSRVSSPGDLGGRPGGGTLGAGARGAARASGGASSVVSFRHRTTGRSAFGVVSRQRMLGFGSPGDADGGSAGSDGTVSADGSVRCAGPGGA
jgi:hypothetical protein